jgi:hypothetical protein
MDRPGSKRSSKIHEFRATDRTRSYGNNISGEYGDMLTQEAIEDIAKQFFSCIKLNVCPCFRFGGYSH